MEYDYLKSQLIKVYFKLKTELLEIMNPDTFVDLWQDTDGNSISLRSDDTLISKYHRVTKIILTSTGPQDIVRSYREQLKPDLSEEDCLNRAVKRLREILLLRRTLKMKDQPIPKPHPRGSL